MESLLRKATRKIAFSAALLNERTTRLFLGTFAELRKVTISFVMSVRPYPWNIVDSHWTDFHEI